MARGPSLVVDGAAARAHESSAVSHQALSPPPPSLSWTVWAVAASFYLAAFYLRSSPAVMTSELMRDFHISAAQLGTFSAVYFYAYIAMQIPTGVLVDTWGARNLLVSGALVAAAGTLLFGATDSYALASIGRLIVGASTAIGWVVTLKIATHWFPQAYFATLSGLGLFMGNVGALFAQVPLRLLVEQFGWRAVAAGSAGVVLVVGAAAFALVANDPADKGFASYAPPELQRRRASTLRESFSGFRALVAHRNTWLIFLAQGGFVGAMLSFTGLWGPSYLRQRFELPATRASAVCSAMIICWAAASPLFGYLSDRIARRKPLYLAGAIGSAIGWTAMFYAPLTLGPFVVVAALTSVACGAVIIGFAYAKESVPVRFLGTISGTINVGNMIGPTILQPAIGAVLDARWSGGLSGGVRSFPVEAYHAAFAMLVAWAACSCLLIAATRETHCRPAA